MLRIALTALLIFCSSSALAGPGLDIRPQMSPTGLGDALSIDVVDLLQGSDLGNQASCTGRSRQCAALTDAVSCVNEGEAFGCAWNSY